MKYRPSSPTSFRAPYPFALAIHSPRAPSFGYARRVGDIDDGGGFLWVPGAPSFGYSRRVGDIDDVGGFLWVPRAEQSLFAVLVIG